VKFRVTRTSTYDEKPCPEAVEGTYTQHLYCTLPLKKAMVAPNTEWFRHPNLCNQRKAPGGSVADKPGVKAWFVEVPHLIDLMAFIGRHGSVVIDRPSDGPTIEIYDGYRE
jgi:hypothetical protein